MKSNKILFGILIGAVGGALLGALFSPEKGSRLRRNIANKSEDYVDELKDKLDDIIENASRSSKKTWHEAEKFLMDGIIKQTEMHDHKKTM
jgi:hypothetical protein